ncbi:MAG: biotin/lipoyl-binding protein [bacterium]
MKEKINLFIKKHKKKIALVLLLAFGYYYWQGTKTSVAVVTKYAFGNVEKGAVITSVSGTGQVSPSNQVEVKPKVAADILAIKVKAGQKVKKGDLLAVLDDKDLRIDVNKARDNLSIAQANLQLKLAGVTPEDIALAKNSVDSAKMTYEIAVKNLSTTEISVRENLAKAQLNLTSSESQYNNTLSSQNINTTTNSQSLATAYRAVVNTVNTSYVSMRTGMTFADSIIKTPLTSLKNSLSVLNSGLLNDANDSLISSKDGLKNFDSVYTSLGANPTNYQIDNAVSQQIELAKSMKQLEHEVYLVLMNTITTADLSQATLDAYRSNASTQESAMNTIIANLQSSQQAVVNARLGIDSGGLSADNSITNASNSLATAKSNLTQAKLDAQKSLEAAKNDVAAKKNSLENSQIQYNQKVAKPRTVDLLSLRVQVTQAQTGYQQALDNLASAKVVSPIDGVVAQVTANVGDQTNISVATPLATVITDKQVANISFNEVDAAKIAVGQKANLVISALGDLPVSGEVASVDLIGVTTQGVVSYSVQIALDVNNEQIKPQMSVTAAIITNKKLDTLLLPNSAIKTDTSGANYVEMFSKDTNLVAQSDGTYIAPISPTQQTVVIGLVSDVSTEILSGLNEGEQVIVKTITTGTTAKTTAQTSGLGILGGGNRGGGGLGR